LTMGLLVSIGPYRVGRFPFSEFLALSSLQSPASKDIIVFFSLGFRIVGPRSTSGSAVWVRASLMNFCSRTAFSLSLPLVRRRQSFFLFAFFPAHHSSRSPVCDAHPNSEPSGAFVDFMDLFLFFSFGDLPGLNVFSLRLELGAPFS